MVLIMYGQAIQETYHYFRRYPKDGHTLKTIIAALLFFDTIHAIFVAHVCFETALTKNSYDDEEAIARAYSLWSFRLKTVVSSLPIGTALVFFGRRVYRLCQHSRRTFVTLTTVLSAIAISE
ncbi:hypothetical protein C8Q80DRAFT_837671 [Daedaleopsis nitida]|nr:hypothetical protein C8Q80DRAFT_837671 [Daedaleopsis nitida]